MNTTHTVQGTIDNAMNITEAISMLTSKYKGCTKLHIERIEVKGNTRYPSRQPEYIYEYALECEDYTCKPTDA